MSPSPKRLTYIVNHLSADDAQHYVHIPNLLRDLERRGWEIDLVSERGGVGQAEVLGRQVTFLSKNEKWRRMARLIGHLLAMRWNGGRLVFVRISKFAALASAVLGRLLGWQTVFWLSGAVEDFNRRRGFRARLGFAGMWILFRLVDRLATGPETMVDYYRRLYRLRPRKIMLLYNDIDLVNASVASATGPAREFNVLLVHRLSPVRETDRYFGLLLESLEDSARASNSTIRVDICGDGPERPALEELAKTDSKAVLVRFHGAVPQRQLDDFYRRATLFVMPSYREGFPRVVIEAMAHGLPIVATDAGGTRDLCGPIQLRYIVDRENPALFGRAVKDLLDSPEVRAEISSENLSSVHRFDTRQVGQMYDAALSRLINADTGPDQ